MLFYVESWRQRRQIGADAGEAGGCIFLQKEKMILKNDKKNEIFGILI